MTSILNTGPIPTEGLSFIRDFSVGTSDVRGLCSILMCLFDIPSEETTNSLKSQDGAWEEYFEKNSIEKYFILPKDLMLQIYERIGYLIAKMEKENAASQRKGSKVKKGRR